MGKFQVLRWAIRDLFLSIWFIYVLVPPHRACGRFAMGITMEGAIGSSLEKKYEERLAKFHYNIGVIKRSTHTSGSHFRINGFLAKMFQGLSNKLASIEKESFWRSKAQGVN